MVVYGGWWVVGGGGGGGGGDIATSLQHSHGAYSIYAVLSNTCSAPGGGMAVRNLESTGRVDAGVYGGEGRGGGGKEG